MSYNDGNRRGDDYQRNHEEYSNNSGRSRVWGGGYQDNRSNGQNHWNNQNYQDPRDQRQYNQNQQWYNGGRNGGQYQQYNTDNRRHNNSFNYGGRGGYQGNYQYRDERSNRGGGFRGSRGNQGYTDGFRRDEYPIEQNNSRYQDQQYHGQHYNNGFSYGNHQGQRRNDGYNEQGFYDSRRRMDQNISARNYHESDRNSRNQRRGGGYQRENRENQNESYPWNRDEPTPAENYVWNNDELSERERNYVWNQDPEDQPNSSQQPEESNDRVRHASSSSSASTMMSVTPVDTPISLVPPNPISSEEIINALQLEQLDLTKGKKTKVFVDAPIPIANRHDKEKVFLTTNFFEMEIKPKIVYKYDVAIKVVASDGRILHLTKNAREQESNTTKRNELCVAALQAALEAYRIVREDEAILYNGAAMLFSSDNLMAELKPHSNSLSIKIHSLPDHIRRKIALQQADSVVVEINACSTGESFNLADFKDTHKNRDLNNLDRTHQHFFDYLTSEPALNSGRYTTFGSGRLFPRNLEGSQNVGNGKIKATGISKGIVFIEPKKNQMVPALVLDAKLGQFFKSQNARKTVCELIRMSSEFVGAFPFRQHGNRVNAYIRGMSFTFAGQNYDKSFVASGISTISISQIKEKDITGRPIPLLQHPRFNAIDISQIRSDWPAIVIRGKFDNKVVTSHYPMELLKVAENQRVPKSKQDDKPPRPIKIQERFGEINRMVEYLNLDTNNAQNYILRAFGVSINRKPKKIEAIRREAPQVVFDSGITANINRDRANFQMNKFIEGAEIHDIVIGYDQNDKKYQLLERVGNQLKQSMSKYGMKVGEFHYFGSTAKHQIDMIEEIFIKTNDLLTNKKIGPKVLIIFIDDQEKKSHGYLKLFERRYLIVTQHITYPVAEEITACKRDTIQNVINKMNIKMGGLNYSLNPENYAQREWISNGKSLIIGYDVAHPTGLSRDDKMDKIPHSNASVVGISFNGAPNPESFIGDFHYQRPNKEQVNDSVLISRVKWILDLFYQNRKQLPENIFIIRDGVSEGQIAMVQGEEFEAIKEGIDEWKELKSDEIPNVLDWTPKYVLAVITKRHNKRFAQEINGRFENPKPGTVIDSQVVRTDMTQFYYQPHRTIQGTSKLPSVQICLDQLDSYDGKKTQDKLQSLLMTLSFSHQISSGSISIPEPVYQADEWAKRGNDIFKVFGEIVSNTPEADFPRLEQWNHNQFRSAPIDYEALTKMFCYRDTPLQQFRINA